MRNIDKLKNEIKRLVAEVKVAKQERKTVRFTGEHTIKSTNQWCSDAERAYLLSLELKKEIRHHHIAYCMLRGKTLEQIEPNTRTVDHFDPKYRNMDYVKEIMNKYAWSPEEIKAYRERQVKVEQVA